MSRLKHKFHNFRYYSTNYSSINKLFFAALESTKLAKFSSFANKMLAILQFNYKLCF